MFSALLAPLQTILIYHQSYVCLTTLPSLVIHVSGLLITAGSTDMDSSGISVRLLRLDSCVVSDALDSMKLPSAVNGIRPLAVRKRITGPVKTVKLGPKPPKETVKRHLCTAAIDSSARGDLIVVEHVSAAECAGWGGVLSFGAKHRGVEGAIVDGPVRDIDEATDIGFPVFGRSVSARTARGRVYEQAHNVGVSIGGVSIYPGDYAVADSNGVVFIPRDCVLDVITRAEHIAERERSMISAIQEGHQMADVMGQDYDQLLNEPDN